MCFWMSLFSLGSPDKVGPFAEFVSSSHYVQYLNWYRFLVDSVRPVGMWCDAALSII